MGPKQTGNKSDWRENRKRLKGLYMLGFDKANKDVNMANVDAGTEWNKNRYCVIWHK